MPPRSARAALASAIVAGAYFGTAKLGFALDVAHGVITPVWAPSGIALASLLLFGIRYWPAVAVGAFVANVTTDAGAAVAAGIAVGNTLEAVVGAALVQRIGFRPRLDRVRDVLALVVGGALLSTMVSATNGVTVLTIAGDRQDSFGAAWLLWWFGDAVGDLMVAPLLLVLSAWRPQRVPPARLLEGAALVAAVAGVSAVVFLGGAWRYPYLLFPLLLWAALRFRSAGAATSSFLVGAVGTWGAVAGKIPFGTETPTERVQIAQALFALVAVSILVVGATLEEQVSGGSDLREAARSLSEAQALAHIGSWRWDIASDRITWSDELYRIFGLEPGRPITYAEYVERIHPDDRAFVQETVRRAYSEGRPYAFEHRVQRPDGTVRTVSGRGQIVVENGEPVAMFGTSQDVTEQRQAERLREDILSAVSHELRTPLTAVLGFAVTLERRRHELSEEEVSRIVAELGAGARRLERLLTDLLDVERVRRGAINVARRPTAVIELVQQAVAAGRDGRNVNITGGPVTANIDGPKVERIVENLVSNAVRHTPKETAILVRVDADGDDLVLCVEDEGPGVPDEHKQAIFETFNRGPKMLSSSPGTGIGLSLVASFAEAHGGRTWVEDSAGGGASFRVLLPDCVLS
jgi:PAS domain S-box-containing protein